MLFRGGYSPRHSQYVSTRSMSRCLTISQSFLSFDLIPGQLADGVYKLSVNANFTSGTGSLAEQMGMEQYSGGLSWTIRVISHPENYFKADYRLNKEGYLEYYWSNKVPPSCSSNFFID